MQNHFEYVQESMYLARTQTDSDNNNRNEKRRQAFYEYVQQIETQRHHTGFNTASALNPMANGTGCP